MLTRRPRGLPWLETRFEPGHDVSVIANVLFLCARGLSEDRCNQLSAWAAAGIERYWSREIRFEGRPLKVLVRVRTRRHNVLKIKLAEARSARFARSHNSGIIRACVKYNYGFFRDAALARAQFELTAAHEFGHPVLHASGGLRHSWGHKGTASVWLQRAHKSSPCYPQEGEIDLMCYYNPSSLGFPERIARTRAAQADVVALLQLGLEAGRQ